MPRLPIVLSILWLAPTACADADRAPLDERVPSSEVPGALAPSPALFMPSFECSPDLGEVETLICATPELAALDLRLDSVWRTSLRSMRDGGTPEADIARVRAFQRGWISGRNDCWKAEDVAGCTRDGYLTRIARIESDFLLAPSGEPTFWVCGGNPANEFVATFVDTDPAAVRVERGDQQESMIAVPAASGSRYVGYSGKEVWFKGGEAVFVWPQTDSLRCLRR